MLDYGHQTELLWQAAQVAAALFQFGPTLPHRPVYSSALQGRRFTDSTDEIQLIKGSKLVLSTEKLQCAILPDGKYVAGEDGTGRFTRNVEVYLAWKKTSDDTADLAHATSSDGLSATESGTPPPV